MTPRGQLGKAIGEDATSGTREQHATEYRESPRISVVVVCKDELEQVRRVLPSIEARALRADSELVIVRVGKWPEGVFETGAKTIVIQGAPDATTAQLRLAGAKRATGDIVAFVENLGAGVEQWLDRLTGTPAPATGDPSAGNEPDAKQARA